MKHLHILLDEAIYDILKEEAFREKISMGEVCRRYFPRGTEVIKKLPVVVREQVEVIQKVKDLGERVAPREYCKKHSMRIGLCKFGCTS